MKPCEKGRDIRRKFCPAAKRIRKATALAMYASGRFTAAMIARYVGYLERASVTKLAQDNGLPLISRAKAQSLRNMNVEDVLCL